MRGKSRSLWWPALFSLILALPGFGQEFEPLLERLVPQSLEWPLDLRFEDANTVLLGAGRDGVYRLSLTEPDAGLDNLVAADSVTFVSRLAASDRWLVAGTTFGPLGWMPWVGRAAYQEDVPMGVILDLDVAGDEVWMLGSRRDENRVWAPGGVILWSATLGEGGITGMTPRMFAESGPGATEMARCHILETGAVRSTGDGRWLVVPGVQPGVFLYGEDGKLERVWQSGELGFVDDCTLDEEEAARLSSQPQARNKWLNERTIVDDAIFWQGFPALVVRTVVEGEPRWTLLQLGDDASAKRVGLPVTGAGPNARLRADVYGNRIAVLVTEYELDPEDRKERPRVVILAPGGK